jgi:hypothetical protein
MQGSSVEQPFQTMPREDIIKPISRLTIGSYGPGRTSSCADIKACGIVFEGLGTKRKLSVWTIQADLAVKVRRISLFECGVDSSEAGPTAEVIASYLCQ